MVSGNWLAKSAKRLMRQPLGVKQENNGIDKG